jgi:PqqD family protein of HPr-rel-A system
MQKFMQWRLTSPGLEYNRDEGAVIYFHPASGDTHLISELAASVLFRLATTPCSEEALVAHHADALVDFDDQEKAQLIADVLQELEQIDLIESA